MCHSWLWRSQSAIIVSKHWLITQGNLQQFESATHSRTCLLLGQRLQLGLRGSPVSCKTQNQSNHQRTHHSHHISRLFLRQKSRTSINPNKSANFQTTGSKHTLYRTPPWPLHQKGHQSQSQGYLVRPFRRSTFCAIPNPAPLG